MSASWTLVTSIGASSANTNINSQSAYPQAPQDGYLSVYATGSADGLDASVFTGQTLAQPTLRLNTNNRIPQLGPGSVDLLVARVPVLEGESISMPITNTTAGALTSRVTFYIEDEE